MLKMEKAMEEMEKKFEAEKLELEEMIKALGEEKRG
jgi:hypothetical protein